MKRFLKEPFLHFVLIGFAIFIVYALTVDDNDSENAIIIDNSDISHMVSIWELQWQRKPTTEELSGLISKTLKQEIMYREALKMNLDHNDEVIKRRLAQKMDFITSDVSAMVNNPTDKDLKNYYNKYSERYMRPAQYSFYQICFTFDNHSDPVNQAKSVLEEHGNVSIEEFTKLGDPLPFPFYYESIYANKLNSELGGNIAETMEGLPLNQWTGPVESGFGTHLVYITEKIEPQLPSFTQMKDVIKRDYDYDMEQESREKIYENLKSSYNIKLEADINKELREKILKEFGS
ncbi:peptidyl-prolyl cis-trans isomerase [Marinigracilibium pacificum]|uniref:peptidylprolyl isomerase n=1 Tax=Marinigracilibium pacificum TaxID=2729599 RepID=A0A848IY79_9BACT|nr:peptidylprolyl isomerase [Marinigracilibium pacificum]NMM48281.1 peptidyl-prolyl cis-trans isomerase [Marinigracilibium pacificum]